MLTNDQRDTLIQIANNARKWSYAPYSKYHVGAALLTSSGRIYEGINIENAAYPSSMCAERVAIFKAVSEGERDFEAIAIVTENGGSPCGACRPVLSEFSPDPIIIVANRQEHVLLETSLRDLLPYAFKPGDLTIPSTGDL